MQGKNYSKGHALVVGIANYANVNTLPTAVLNDATDLASVLTNPDLCGYDLGRVHVLFDGEATLAKLRAHFTNLAAAAAPDDTVVIYFSGHGALIGGPDNTSALLPVDFVPTSPDATSLSESELSALLKRVQARKLVILLDACHAAGAASIKHHADAPPAMLGYDEKSLDRLAQGAGRVLIASCRSSETSLILHGSRNSVFTQHLLEGLRGEMNGSGDGLIHIFDLFNHIAEKVKQTVPGKQHPIFKASDLEDNFAVALDRGRAKLVETTFEPTLGSGSTDSQGLEEIAARLYPLGPTDQEIWARAGGDIAQLQIANKTGRAAWFGALRTLNLGGGGRTNQPAWADTFNAARLSAAPRPLEVADFKLTDRLTQAWARARHRGSGNCSGTLRRLFMPPTSEDVNGAVGCLPTTQYLSSICTDKYSREPVSRNLRPHLCFQQLP